MTARERPRSAAADTSSEAYDDVPMPKARPRAAKPGGSLVAPVWIVVVIAIVAVAGFIASPLGQRLTGLDLAALLAPAAAPGDDAGPSVPELDRRLSAAEGAIAAVVAEAERLARQTTALDDSERVARIEQSLAALRERASAADDLAPRLAPLEAAAADAAAVAGRVSALETAAADTAAADDVAALRLRVAALEQAPAADQQAAVAVARLTALARRVDALDRSRTDAADLGARLVRAARRIDALEAAARDETAVGPAQVGELAHRIEALEAAREGGADELMAAFAQRLDALEMAAGDDSVVDPAQVGELARRVDALEAAAAAGDETAVHSLELRVGALEAGLIDAAPAAALRSLENKLGALERAAANAGRGAALAVAVARLREAAQLSEPYAAALDEVRALAGPIGDADLAAAVGAIEGRAATGVPNVEALRERFAALVAPILHADGLGEEAGWIAKTLNRLTSVVTVRRTGEVAGPTTEARIARAEARLAGRDLAAAIEDLAPLAVAPGGPLTAWLADARARLALDRALDQVSARALALLSPS